jgi:hypothetical protein
MCRFQRTRSDVHHELLRSGIHPDDFDNEAEEQLVEQIENEIATMHEMADFDALPIGHAHAEEAMREPHPDPADSIRSPDARRGFQIERRKHPDWSHHHLMNRVYMNLQQNPRAYDETTLRAEERQRRPDRHSRCSNCKHFYPFLDAEGDHAGVCGHQHHLGQTVAAESLCENWRRGN